MIIVWYLVCKVLVKNILCDKKYHFNEKINIIVAKNLKIIASLLYQSIIIFINNYIPVDKTPMPLEYYHNLTCGNKDPKSEIIIESIKNKQKIDILKKKQVHKLYINAYSKLINSDTLYDEIEENTLLLYQMSKFIEMSKNDSKSYLEITEISENLYHQQELKDYSFISKGNNFNLMKIIWEWIDKVFKLVCDYSEKLDSKEKLITSELKINY